MTAQNITIPSHDAKAIPAYLALPASGTGPAVVLIVTIRGVKQDMRDYADRLAEEGFCVAVPDPFWRDEDPGVMPDGENGHARGLARLGRIDPEMAVRDIETIFDHLKAQPRCNGKSAMVGFCFGGTLAMLAAQRLDIDGGVAFHSGKLLHLLDGIDRVKCPLSYHWGDNDAVFPMADIEKVQAVFAGLKQAEVIVYPGAPHGFMESGNPAAYRPDAAEAAWARGLEVLKDI